ncbi:MAG: RNA helicase, partial [Burkholderiaceae bacterium]|nr:RNA helicase [Burkholderiaceae bacterium]
GGGGSGARQPDPLRTSIDAMSERSRGNGGNRRPGGGGGGRGGNNAGMSRGPADPLRTNFGRIK